MIKNRSEQVMKSRSKSGTVRLELLVPPEIKAQFEELATINWISKREVFERLVDHGIADNFSGEVRAKELLELHGMDRKKAGAAFLQELREQFPGITTTSEEPKYSKGVKRYGAFHTGMDRLCPKPEKRKGA